MSKINIIDLFAGCGGITDGFEKANGYETIAAVEWDKVFCDTLVRRLENKWKYKDASNRVLLYDMQRVDNLLNGWGNDPKFGSNIGLKKTIGNKKVHLIVGGPPCQAYSVAGRVRDKRGMHYDYRNFLFESYISTVNVLKPDVIIFENVLGMLSAKPGGVTITERIRKGFSKAGYYIIDDLKKAVVNMSDYGIPQDRRRVIIVGLNKEVYKNPELVVESFYQKYLTKFKVKMKKTVRDAIGDLPGFYPMEEIKIINGKKYSHFPQKSDIPDHTPRYHNKRDIEIFKQLASDAYNGHPTYTSAEDLKKLYTLRTGKESAVHKYHVLKWDSPSNTIPAHLNKDGLRHIHPDPQQARTLTVREAARIQTFDDNFIFTGSAGNNYKMIGNAVPPLFAEILAKTLKQLITV